MGFIGQHGTAQRIRGPVKAERSRSHVPCLSIAGLLSEVYIYMIVRHPRKCTGITVDVELDIRYPEGEETSEITTSHE